MFNRLAGFAPHILGITRILTGVMLFTHGAQKLLGAFGGPGPGLPAPVLWIAGSIELGCGALLAIGLFTRQAAFLTSGFMAAAYFSTHAPQGFWPIQNGGELAIAFSWISLYLCAQGPGAWALDDVRMPHASSRQPAAA